VGGRCDSDGCKKGGKYELVGGCGAVFGVGSVGGVVYTPHQSKSEPPLPPSLLSSLTWH